MMRKFKLISVFVLLVLVLSAGSGAVLAQEPGGPRVIKRIVDRPSDIDRDWPIVRVERKQVRDPVTGRVFWNKVVVRRSPPSYRPPEERMLSSCSDDKTSVSTRGHAVTPLNNCTYSGSETRSSDNHVGGVVAYNKQYADRYCGDENCFEKLYAAYQEELWWTRTSTDWKADGAELAWGCDGCMKCDESRWYYVYEDGPFTPYWQSDTRTVTYRYTSDYPELEPVPGFGIYLQANSWSDVYQRISGEWEFIDDMFTQTRFP